MGLVDKILSPVRDALGQSVLTSGFRTFTEQAPAFTSWDGTLYEQAQTRAIVERIATACSKLKPEFVTPDGSGGSVPRIQRLFTSWPNDTMSWPDFLRRVATILYVETTAYIVPQYDPRDGGIVGLWPLKPRSVRVIEYEGEPFARFELITGDVLVFPFHDVVILTRFQLDSDYFGGGNLPLTPTLRLMDAQRQAEEIALKTGADIRFIGRVSNVMHGDDLREKRKAFSEENLNTRNNPYGLLLYDQSFESVEQIKNQSYTTDPDKMARIDKALYTYFGINEKILTSDYDDQTWAAFYESVIEWFALSLGEAMTRCLLTSTQVRKGNRIMFSASYLEYATTDAKIKVANFLATTGTGSRNEIRDIFQLPRIPGGDTFTFRGEYYTLDPNNNIIAQSGGRPGEDTSLDEAPDTLDDMPEEEEP